jgi:hypothetical protein
MAIILYPNYSIQQIINNYRTGSYTTDGSFISANFSTVNSYIPAVTAPTHAHTLSLSYLNSIIYDYGSGMLSKNIASLDSVQLNIINDTSNNLFFINNIAGFPIEQFLSATPQQSSTIVASFINIQQLFSVNIDQFSRSLNSMLSSIATALKRKTFNSSNYSGPLLSLVQNICKYLIRSNTY